MVDGLLARGMVRDPRVAAVLREVPRHVFVPEAPLEEAYQDRAIPTKYREGRPTSSASQPAIVARMLEQLQVQPGQSVLEIGAGTGYNAALLARLVGKDGAVVTVEIDAEVVEKARAHLVETGLANVQVECGDGADGWPEGAPYDRIIVTVGASDLAPAWLEQLAPDGRLVLPLSLRGVQQCVAFAWTDGHLESRSICDCGFMPLEGTLASSDIYHPVPDHHGVTIVAREGLEVEIAVLSAALSQPGSRTNIGVAATPMEAFGSLRRWLAFREPSAAQLTCVGPPDQVAGSPVPRLLELPLNEGTLQRTTAVVLGDSGLAALDRNELDRSNSTPEMAIPLAARSFGSALREAERLVDLVRGWDAAGRPPTSELHIAAYPLPHPAIRSHGIVERTRHTTFVITTA